MYDGNLKVVEAEEDLLGELVDIKA